MYTYCMIPVYSYLIMSNSCTLYVSKLYKGHLIMSKAKCTTGTSLCGHGFELLFDGLDARLPLLTGALELRVLRFGQMQFALELR